MFVLQSLENFEILLNFDEFFTDFIGRSIEKKKIKKNFSSSLQKKPIREARINTIKVCFHMIDITAKNAAKKPLSNRSDHNHMDLRLAVMIANLLL